MTEPGTAAPTVLPADAPDAGPEPRTGLLTTLALAWLAAQLFGARAEINANGVELVTMTAAAALAGVVAASLLAGGAAGLAVTSALAVRGLRAAGQAPARVGLAALAGLLTGGVASAAIALTWGTQGSVAGLAVTVALAGALGGALTAAIPTGTARTVAAAGLAAGVGVLITGFVLGGLFKDSLLGLFGAGDTAASRHSALGWFAFTLALASGLVGGLVAYWHLRRTVRLSGVAGLRWPAYLVAGATPGALLLIAEAVTRIGGAQLLALAAAGGELDSTALDWAGSSRLNHGVFVLFLGAIVALIAFGRSLPARRD